MTDATTAPPGMEPEYAGQYRDLYQRHWWWRAREVIVLETLQRLREGRGPGRVLDIGCGDGLFFNELARFGEVEGVEPDTSLLTPGSPHSSRITVAPFDESYQPEHRYDLILMLDVLEHIDDPTGALRHSRSLLASDGKLVITVPAFPWLWTHHDKINRHHIRYTRETLAAQVSEAGLRLDEARYFFRWTVPGKLAARAKEAVLGPGGPERVPSAAINRGLYLLSRAEHALIGRLPLPLGTSLMAVCAANQTEQP
jgi:SAM-dependent methyltransferase